MTQEEKERKSFGKFKGLISITDQAHVMNIILLYDLKYLKLMKNPNNIFGK
jgi:hypothetical protein